MNVRFKFGTQSQYDSLLEKDPAVLYFIEDTQRIYKGDELFGVGANATELLSGLLSSEDKIALDSLSEEIQTKADASEVQSLSEEVATKLDKNHGYYTVDIGGTPGAWTAEIEGLTELTEGLIINIYPADAQPAEAVTGDETTTLNINNLGAYPIYLYGNGNDDGLLNSSTYNPNLNDYNATDFLAVFLDSYWYATFMHGTRPVTADELNGNDLGNYPVSADAVRDTVHTLNTSIATKQNAAGNSSLETIDKSVVGAINEVNGIAKGAQKALSFMSISAMVTDLNSKTSADYKLGQSIFIVTLDVPDVWISKFEASSVPYVYTTDEAFVTALETDGYVQCGYIKVSALETEKVDLTNYYTKSEDDTLLAGKANKEHGFYSVDAECTSAGVWTAEIDGITEMLDGMTVNLALYDTSLPKVGSGTTTLNINDLGAYPIELYGNGDDTDINDSTFDLSKFPEYTTSLLCIFWSDTWYATIIYGMRTIDATELAGSDFGLYPVSADAVRDAIATINTALAAKQNATDSYLETNSKTIVGAINELNQIGRDEVFNDISSMITALDADVAGRYTHSRTLFIRTPNVPDLWISGSPGSHQTYNYTTDEAFINDLRANNNQIGIGYYYVSAIETDPQLGRVEAFNYDPSTGETTSLPNVRCTFKFINGNPVIEVDD